MRVWEGQSVTQFLNAGHIEPVNLIDNQQFAAIAEITLAIWVSGAPRSAYQPSQEQPPVIETGAHRARGIGHRRGVEQASAVGDD